MMVVVRKPSCSWWFDSHNSPRQSLWLASAIAELDERTKAILRLIEQDADSFGQRAEMYYKKRPELVNMVEDFYRTHRSLAEQFDQLKHEGRTRYVTPSSFPASTKRPLPKLRHPVDRSSRASSASFDSEESEIDDPEEEEEIESQSGNNLPDKRGLGNDHGEETKRERSELERMREENRALKARLEEKDEEKRQTIRQLCLSVDVLKEENTELKRYIGDSRKKKGAFDIKKLGRGLFPGNLSGGRPLVAL